ncbi:MULTISPECIES: DNA-binding protein [Pectobacterium]|uniref:YobI family P-loop NTPase n=1 Tax=Pectobacterium TaxID=122277 RepID=UPI00301A25EE
MDVLSKAIYMCRRAETWLLKVQSLKKPPVTTSPYDTLAPKCINDEKMQEYFRALKFALATKDVRNIAITGNYGAGKSTVVSSFMKYHCDEQYINVSLAGFDMTENDKTVAPTHQEVELSILQQILYKENRDKLPDSRIDRILNRGWYHTLKTYLSLLKVALPTAAFFCILFFSKVEEQLGLPKEWSDNLDEYYILRGISLISLAFISLFFLTQISSRIGIFDKKIRLGKIAFLSGDMEFKDKEPSSLLNNCLDEIVYFFSRRPYKVVVFEDLDRLGTPEIFVKLREINKIINNNRANKKPVRFIYAVRDDLFLGAEARTKFFDFIIPVVPFMDSRNAFTLLKNKTPLLDKSSDVYLKKIASYLGDMRSLQNIANEFQVFCKIVDNSINKTKLFSLVFYKNAYALDYHLADKKTGLLFSFIHNYRTQKLQNSYFSSLDDQLNEYLIRAKKLDEEIATLPQDIRRDIITDFIPEILWGRINLASRLNIHNFNVFDTAELVNNAEYFINAFTQHGDLYLGYTDVYGHFRYDPLNAIIQTKAVTDYNDRVKILGEDKSKTYYKIHNEIRRINNTIRARNATPLAALIKSEGRDKFKKTAQEYLDAMEHHEFVTEQQLLALRTDMQYGGLDALYMLFSDGLIMQDFMSYRSIFHEGSLSINDNEFIKAVGQDLSSEKSNQDHYVDDADKVISELAEQNRLCADGAFHYQLLGRIIETNNSYFTDMIASLFQHSDEHIYKIFEILSLRFVKTETFEIFVVRALKISDYLVRMLLIMKANRNTPSHDTISIVILSCTSPESREEKKYFRDYIHFLGSLIIRLISDEKMDKFTKNLLKVSASYNELFTPDTTNELSAIRFIAENSLYQINKENVGIVISSLLPTKKTLPPEEAQKKPWTLIHQYKVKVLIKYYTDNIEDFVQNVFIYSDEDSDCIKEILEKSELSDKSKEIIIKVMDFSLSELSGLSAKSSFYDESTLLSFHDLFYQYDRVIPTWPTLMDYIDGDCNETILHEWLTKHASNLGQCNNVYYDEVSYISLYEKIICNDNIDEKTYSTILNPVEINMEKIDNKLSVRNFGRLIANQKLLLDEVAYQKVISVYSSPDDKMANTLLLWFSQYKESFTSSPDFYLLKSKNINFFKNALNKLMFSNYFNDTEKSQLVIHYTEHYLENDILDIHLPRNVAILVINQSDNTRLKAMLLTRVISGGYRNKTHIAELCHKLNESDLSNVFLKRTQATITANNDALVMLILGQSQDAGIIKDFETRDDGKIAVTIRREKDEDQ